MSGLDGIRQDTLPYVHRRFWKEWMAAIGKQYPDLKVVGELFDADPALVSFYQGGVERFDGIDSGVDTLFDFPLYFKIRDAFAKGGSLRDVAMMLARDHLYRDASPLVTFLGLHDVPRFMNEPGASIASLKSAFTFLATARGTPLVYYGDEIAMPGGGDPTTAGTSRAGGRRTPGARSRARGAPPTRSRCTRTCGRSCSLRQATPALRRGRTVNLHVADRSVGLRAGARRARAVVVAINTGGGDRRRSTCRPRRLGLAGRARLRDRVGSLGRDGGRRRDACGSPCRLAHRGYSRRRSNDPLDLSGIIHEIS